LSGKLSTIVSSLLLTHQLRSASP